MATGKDLLMWTRLAERGARGIVDSGTKAVLIHVTKSVSIKVGAAVGGFVRIQAVGRFNRIRDPVVIEISIHIDADTPRFKQNRPCSLRGAGRQKAADRRARISQAVFTHVAAATMREVSGP